jgi:putative SOS response-associated peptidase YedK
VTLADKTELETFTIITTAPNDLCRTVHDRMPVILQNEDYDRWLDPKFDQTEALLSILCPYPTELMACYPGSTLVKQPTKRYTAMRRTTI